MKKKVPETPEEWEQLLKDTCESLIVLTGSRGVALVLTSPCWKPAGQCSMGIAGRDPSVGTEIAGHLREAAGIILEYNDNIVHRVPFSAEKKIRKD